MEKEKSIIQNEEKLYSKIAELIEASRRKIASTVNLTMVYTYFEIGRIIVEDEQDGEFRAEYGKKLIRKISFRLLNKYGKGFSEMNIRNMRQFYNSYSERALSIQQTVSVEFKNRSGKTIPIRQTVSAKLNNMPGENSLSKASTVTNFSLSWSHYLVLMKIENPLERNFYEVEATNQNWSERQLKRQYHSSLYERLALSRNKEEVMKLSNEGQLIYKPQDLLKNPLTLEFLGLDEKATFSESEMEQAIIHKLQHFLLELGKGFLFEARQKRFSFDGEHYYVDLVFYNRLLQCYCLIDIKVEKITHQHLGQMQMYVNYFDRFVKKDYEKPTVGILLCKKKSDAIVELTLPIDANIYASEYSLYLPEKELLKRKLNEWIEEFEE